MQNNIKNIFVGLDTDTESKYVSPASYIDANNIRITPSTDNKETYLQNIPGNKVLDLQVGNSWVDGVVVGKCKDYQYGYIYYFICSKNTSTEDCIYKVDCNTEKVSIVLSSNYLFPNYRTAGLLKTNINPVVSATIYDNKMFWCDGTDTSYSHPPRFLDLNLASDINSLTTDITDLISVLLWTPIYPITCNVVITIDNVINYLCDSSKDYQSKEHPLLKSSGNMTGILSLPKSVYFGSSSKEKLKNYFTDYKNDNTLTAKFEYDDLKLLLYV